MQHYRIEREAPRREELAGREVTLDSWTLAGARFHCSNTASCLLAQKSWISQTQQSTAVSPLSSLKEGERAELDLCNCLKWASYACYFGPIITAVPRNSASTVRRVLFDPKSQDCTETLQLLTALLPLHVKPIQQDKYQQLRGGKTGLWCLQFWRLSEKFWVWFIRKWGKAVILAYCLCTWSVFIWGAQDSVTCTRWTY